MSKNKLCECGCGETVASNNRFISGHENRGRTPWMKGRKHTEETKQRMRATKAAHRLPPPEPQLCACGCGELANPGRKYINGHQNRGKVHTAETRRKFSESHIGNHHTEEAKRKISEAFRGEKHPQYGKRGVDSPNYGTHMSDEAKQKISRARMGMKFSEEHKQNLSKATTRYLQNQRWNALVGSFIKGSPIRDWIDPLISNTYAIDDWRYAVYARDNYTCKVCGATNCVIHAHHIMTKHKYPDLAYDVDNGIALCKRCHESVYGKEERVAEELRMMITGDL